MLRLQTLGPLSLHADGVPVLPGRRKLLCVLAFLVRSRSSVSRPRLASLFWPVEDEVRSRRSVRQALASLRQVLGPALAERHGGVAVIEGAISCDASELDAAGDAGTDASVLSFWRGEFLAGADDVGGPEFQLWLEAERQHLRGTLASVAARCAADAERRGAWQDGLDATSRWCAALPLDEGAHLRHVQLLRAAGQRSAAARVASDFAERLWRELGEAPSEEFRHTMAELVTFGPAAESHDRLAVFSPDLIGRQREMAALAQSWERVRAGAPGVAIVEGEAGLGRSRLLDECARAARTDATSAVLLQARAFDAERERSWLYARHLLAGLVGAPGLIAAPAASLRALGGILPELLERLPSLPAVAPEPDIEAAMARVLADVAAAAPVLVLADDLHLADRESRALVAALCRHPVQGVLVIASALRGALPELDRVAQPASELNLRLRLAPLTAQEVGQMLISMAELGPADADVLARRLHADTDGSPLLVTEYFLALVRAGSVAMDATGSWALRLSHDADLPIPESLQAAMRGHLTHQSPGARAVLDSAAVLGPSGSLRLLRALSGLDPAALDSELDRLVDQRMLRLDAASPGRFDFSHRSLHRAAYDAIPVRLRRRLHRRAWRLLQQEAGAGVARADELAYHRARAGVNGQATRWLTTAAIFAVTVIGIAWLSHRNAPLAAPVRVALMPFTAAADSAGLGELVAELLAAAMDGADSVELVNPLAVTELPSPDSVAALAAAKAEAHRLHAAVWLGGSVTAMPGRVRLHAVMRRAHDGAVLAEARGEAAAEELPALASQLARTLLATGPPLGAPHRRLAGVRTVSMPALALWLSGERHARRFEMEAAAQDYWQAVQHDPGFAAAWNALARVNAWFWLGDQATKLSDSASAHADGLPPQDRRTLMGWQFFAHGKPDEAERQFEGVLGYAPASAEAAIGLGEVLFHHNWSRGRSMHEAGRYLELARQADPGDWRPYVHLWEQAVRDGRMEDAVAELRRLRALMEDTSSTSALGAELALAQGDSVGVSAWMASASGMDAWSITGLAQTVAAIFGKPRLAGNVARLLTAPSRTPELRAFGHEMQAWTALAEGRWRAALAQVDTARGFEPSSAATTEALLWISPFVPNTALRQAGRRAELARLARSVPDTVPRTLDFWFDFDRTREPVLRTYLAAILRAELDASSAPPAWRPRAVTPPDSLRHVRELLERSLAGWRAAVAGDTLAAVTALQGEWEGTEAVEGALSVFLARPWDRLLLGDLLARTGRYEAALHWYGGLGTVSLADAAYLAPAARRRAQLLERLGRRAEAAREYRRVVELWKDADPEFQPMVSAARERIVELAKDGT